MEQQQVDREWWPPRWAMHARRSLTLPSGSLLMEMFMQGKEVSMAKASGGGRFVVWNHPLEELRACAASSVFKAKNELLARGFLVELPGARVSGTNGRAFSGWMTPLERPAEYTPISGRTPEYTPNSVSSWEVADSEEAPEYTPISGSTAQPVITPRVRARGGEHHHQQTTTTNNDFSSPDPFSPGVKSTGQVDHVQQLSGDLRYDVAAGGLRWAKLRSPEQALSRFGVERCLVAVEALTGKHEANEYVGKPGGFVWNTLLALEFVEVVPVCDLGFARWWDVSVLPGNVAPFRRAK